MFTVFRQIVEDQFAIATAQMDALQKIFQNDRVTGLIKIRSRRGQVTILLYAAGHWINSYRMESERCFPVSPEEATHGWQEQGSSIHFLRLPEDALWTVWLALELYPPTHHEYREGRQVSTYLVSCETRHDTGLIQFNSTESDGFTLLWDGRPVLSDTIFSAASGFIKSLPSSRLIQENATEPWEISYYALEPSKPLHQRLLLRTSMDEWMKAIILQHQEMIGRRLMNNLITNINETTQSRQWNISLNDKGLVDYHIFSDIDTCALAYQALMRSTADHIAYVVGHTLTRRILRDTYAALADNTRRALDGSGLGPHLFSR